MIPSNLDFRLLKRKVTIEQVLADRGLLDGLTRRGARLAGPCPIHGGDNPGAFVVSLEKHIWWCFTGCNAGGDVVELARRLCRLTYRETAHYLARLASAQPEKRPQHITAPALRRFRVFTNRLRLDHDTPLLTGKGIRSETARRFEAGRYYGPGMLAGCVAVRLHDTRGRPLGYTGRRLDPEQVQRHGKWVFPSRLPRNSLLYGFHHAYPLLLRRLVVVECPWGVMRLTQLSIPTVALLGTHLSKIQMERMSLAPRIVLLMDGDNAGRKAAFNIHQKLTSRNNVKICDLPDGCDPDDLTEEELSRRIGPFLL